MLNAALYARYSSKKQTPETLKTQLEINERYCIRESLTPVATFTDSAKTRRNENREGYQDMLEGARRGDFDVIICYKYDRFGGDYLTNIMRLAELQLLDIEVWSATEGKDPFTRNISLAVSERESHVLGQRVRDGMKAAAERRGLPLAMAPFGYTTKLIDGKRQWVKDPETAPTINALFRLALEGNGQHRIANALNDLGHKTPTGKRWYPALVRDILNNPRYTGTLTWNLTQKKKTPTGQKLIAKPVEEQVWKKNNHEPYISMEDWEYLRRRISKRSKGKPKGIIPGKYLLTGLIKCLGCGRNYGHSDGKVRRAVYCCHTAKHRSKAECPKSKRIKADELENWVIQTITRVALNKKNIQEQLDRILNKTREDPNRERRDIEQALEVAKKAEQNLLEAFRIEGHSKALGRALQEEEDRIAKLEKQLANLKPVTLPTHKETEDVRNLYIMRLNGSVPEARRALSDLDCQLKIDETTIKMQVCLPFLFDQAIVFEKPTQLLPIA